MEELSIRKQITYTPGEIQFSEYESLMKAADQVAEYVNSVEVTPDTVKSAKADLAAARKVVKALNDRRIAIKKGIMKNYTTFEAQIKDICSVIEEADETLNGKVRQLEEAERKEKQNLIREIWDKRIWQYRIGRMVPDAFEKWLQPKHLNKTVTMSSVEKDMVQWLERTETDLEALDSMSGEYMVEYIGCLDLPTAISAVNTRNERKQIVKETSEEESASFTVYGKANIRLVEMLLKENEIKYRKD